LFRRGQGWLGNYLLILSQKKQLWKIYIIEKRRKELRSNLTSAEATLWIHLQRKQLHGRKFRRQHSIGNYIVDFYCPSEKLVVELDGEQHYTSEGLAYDARRTKYLALQGVRVIRFENSEICMAWSWRLKR
jgi:very-short-patch-repair endonuclease